jgi:hypothetical protein
MDAEPLRRSGSGWTDLLGSLGIAKTEPVSRSSDSGARADEARLLELLDKGDPLAPASARVPEEVEVLKRLLAEAGECACPVLRNRPLQFLPISLMCGEVAFGIGDRAKLGTFMMSEQEQEYREVNWCKSFPGICLCKRKSVCKRC